MMLSLTLLLATVGAPAFEPPGARVSLSAASEAHGFVGSDVSGWLAQERIELGFQTGAVGLGWLPGNEALSLDADLPRIEYGYWRFGRAVTNFTIPRARLGVVADPAFRHTAFATVALLPLSWSLRYGQLGVSLTPGIVSLWLPMKSAGDTYGESRAGLNVSVGGSLAAGWVY